MPQKDDFLLRMVEKMAQVVASILTLKKQGRLDEAQQLLNQAYREHTGSEGELLQRLPTEQLLDLLSTAGVLDAEKCLIIAELLQVDGQLRAAQGEAVPAALALKALDLNLEALQTEPELLVRLSAKVDALIVTLEPYALPAVSERRLFEYYAMKGAYARAEDKLFALLEDAPTDELVQRGRRFYQALAGLSDEALAAGELPRDELAEGLASLERYARAQ